MTKEQLLEIINDNDEKEYVEFKTNFPADKFYKEIGEYISALSNSATLHKQNDAYMIWGVEDTTRRIVGTIFKYDIQINGSEVFKHFLARKLSPSIAFKFEEFEINNNRVVALTIPSAISTITEFDNERYIRIGSSKEKLRKFPEYEKELWKVLNKDDEIVEIEARRQDLTFAHLKNYLISKGNHINENTFYKNYNLLNSKGKFNRMAEILADENDIIVNVMTFKGKDKTQYLKREEFGYTCLLWAYERAKNYVQAMNQTYIDTSVRPRREKQMFDFDAFNEAWINACVHNLWAESNHPGIYIYEDRLVVESQGGIPKKLTKNKFLNGVSEPVNRELMDIFIKCDICEESGHGVPLVINAYGEDAYEFSDHFIDVTIPFDKLGFTDKNTEKNSFTVNLSEREQKIIELIRSNPNYNASDIAKELGVTRQTINNQMKILKGKGIVVRIGADKNGHWEVKI